MAIEQACVLSERRAAAQRCRVCCTQYGPRLLRLCDETVYYLNQRDCYDCAVTPLASATAGADSLSAVIPTKLKDDAIVEAVCELRFDTAELPEIVVGRATDNPEWRNFGREVGVAASIPAPLRHANQDLRFLPQVLLLSEGRRKVAVGDSSFSYHVLGKYCGWSTFNSELDRAIKFLFGKLTDISVHRIGLRYVNALVPSRHNIAGVQDLNLEVRVNRERIPDQMVLSYVGNPSVAHFVTTNIAAPRFVAGNVPKDAVAFVDVDVSTSVDFRSSSVEEVLEWIRVAHDFEKAAFFRLIPPDVLTKLVEE